MIDPGEFSGAGGNATPDPRPDLGGVYGTGRTWDQLEETLRILGRERDTCVSHLTALARIVARNPSQALDPEWLEDLRTIGQVSYRVIDRRISAAVRAYEALRRGYDPRPADLAALTDDLNAHRGPEGAARYGEPPQTYPDPEQSRSRIARQDFPTVERQRQDAPVETDAPEEGAEEDPYEFGRPLDPLISRKRAEFARELVAYGRIKGEEIRDEELSREQRLARRRYEFARWLREHGRIGI